MSPCSGGPERFWKKTPIFVGGVYKSGVNKTFQDFPGCSGSSDFEVFCSELLVQGVASFISVCPGVALASRGISPGSSRVYLRVVGFEPQSFQTPHPPKCHRERPNAQTTSMGSSTSRPHARDHLEGLIKVYASCGILTVARVVCGKTVLVCLFGNQNATNHSWRPPCKAHPFWFQKKRRVFMAELLRKQRVPMGKFGCDP